MLYGYNNKPIYVDIQCHVHMYYTYRCVVMYCIVCTCIQCTLFGTTCCVLVSTGHCPGSLRLQHGSQGAGWCRQCGQCSEWSEHHTQQDGGQLGRRPARSQLLGTQLQDQGETHTVPSLTLLPVSLKHLPTCTYSRSFLWTYNYFCEWLTESSFTK